MDTKTETGYLLQSLNYIDSEVERFDELAFHLYCGRMDEMREKLAVLIYQFDSDRRVFTTEYLDAKYKEFDKILQNRK